LIIVPISDIILENIQKEVFKLIIVSLKKVPKKEQGDHAHLLLKTCLEKKGISYERNKTPVTRNSHGKPSLTEFPDIKYNLSHADGVTACMISDKECGIDCEGIRDYRPNVIKRAFSENEKILLENTDEKNLLFFRLWTLKEAYVKAIGIGISYPLNTVEFSFDGNKILSNITDCSFKQYIIKNSYIVSICERTDNND